MAGELSALLGADAASCTLPRYGGGSILNLPAEIGRLLGVDLGWAAPALSEGVSVGAPAPRRLAVLVIDGLGWWHLRRHAAADPAWERLVAHRGAVARTLTSVSPATTTVATTALLSNGASPARSGMLGFSQRLPELGRVADMLSWRTLAAPGLSAAPLEALGVVPERFLPTPSLFETLERGGVACRAFLPAAIRTSPLSRAQFRGAAPQGTAGLGDALDQLGELLAQRRGACFAYLYHPELDTVGHRHGPGSAVWDATLTGILSTLESWLASVPAAARRGSVLLVTADHGLVPVARGRRRSLASLSEVAALLGGPAGGEPRHVHLYARPGAREALLEVARDALRDDFVIVDGRRALAAGLYGDPAHPHPEAERRVGDVVALARGEATLWPSDPPPALAGMHGSLDEREMRVPLLSVPLDG